MILLVCSTFLKHQKLGDFYNLLHNRFNIYHSCAHLPSYIIHHHSSKLKIKLNWLRIKVTKHHHLNLNTTYDF